VSLGRVSEPVFFTSPRLRGEVGSPLAIRVRGTIRESECVEGPPHPDPLLASGERENYQPRVTLFI
jgi:hypothetical protein